MKFASRTGVTNPTSSFISSRLSTNRYDKRVGDTKRAIIRLTTFATSSISIEPKPKPE